MNARMGRNGKVSGRHAASALLLLLSFLHHADADSVFKCRDTGGHITYQDHACANTQLETRVEIATAPTPTPSPEYGAVSHAHRPSRHESARAASRHGGAGTREVVSYECRASNGDVFYRHSGCPKSIKSSGSTQGRGNSKKPVADSVTVSAVPMTRSEACRRQAASGLGRAGHEHDDPVSTYDRNAGRDPCRHF
ncbi:MAG: DUF4124 domain-containing protein [Dokdonella sp.]